MTLDPLVTFEHEPLTEAIHALTPEELQLLLVLALGACPRTRRVWTTPLRLADELNARAVPRTTPVSPTVIDARLSVLLGRGHVTLYARSHGALCSYEVTSLHARSRDEPPPNLPVEPTV